MLLEVRAWNKEKSIMVYDNEDDSSDYFDGICCSDIYMVNSTLKKESIYEWLPFTGRWDDSGEHRKIYKGDFIERVYRRSDKEDFIGEVHFYNGRWVITNLERKCIDLYEGDVFEDYVFGNCYENGSIDSWFDKSNSFLEPNLFNSNDYKNKIIVDSKEYKVPITLIKSIIEYILSEKVYYKINIKPEDSRLFCGSDEFFSESILKLFMEGSFLNITDVRDNCMSYALSLSRILDGIELYINLFNPKKLDMGDWNVHDYSCCFQLSIFSKVKYGN